MAAAGFKPVVGSVKRVPGGFDSHPLPLHSVARLLFRMDLYEPRSPCNFLAARPKYDTGAHHVANVVAASVSNKTQVWR